MKYKLKNEEYVHQELLDKDILQYSSLLRKIVDVCMHDTEEEECEEICVQCTTFQIKQLVLFLNHYKLHPYLTIAKEKLMSMFNFRKMFSNWYTNFFQSKTEYELIELLKVSEYLEVSVLSELLNVYLISKLMESNLSTNCIFE
jgi:hypothetical protein